MPFSNWPGVRLGIKNISIELVNVFNTDSKHMVPLYVYITTTRGSIPELELSRPYLLHLVALATSYDPATGLS